jgi:hypothetical protein
VLPEFSASIFMTNRSGISSGLSNLNVILSPDLSKTIMLGVSVIIYNDNIYNDNTSIVIYTQLISKTKFFQISEQTILS